MSYEIASEFFQLVIQKRRHEGDLATPILQRQVPVRRLWDEREPELLFDTGDGVQRQETPVPVPYLSGRGRSK